MAEEFKPQYQVATLSPTYLRVDHSRWEKRYYGAFRSSGKFVKSTRKYFRTATSAEIYARLVEDRYRRLLDAKWLALSTEPAQS